MILITLGEGNDNKYYYYKKESIIIIDKVCSLLRIYKKNCSRVYSDLPFVQSLRAKTYKEKFGLSTLCCNTFQCDKYFVIAATVTTNLLVPYIVSHLL